MFAESGGRTWYVAGEGDPVEGWLIPLSEEDLANGVDTFPEHREDDEDV
jgi:hypothetical protein